MTTARNESKLWPLHAVVTRLGPEIMKPLKSSKTSYSFVFATTSHRMKVIIELLDLANDNTSAKKKEKEEVEKAMWSTETIAYGNAAVLLIFTQTYYFLLPCGDNAVFNKKVHDDSILRKSPGQP